MVYSHAATAMRNSHADSVGVNVFSQNVEKGINYPVFYALAKDRSITNLFYLVFPTRCKKMFRSGSARAKPYLISDSSL